MAQMIVPRSLERLSARERQILELAAQGRTDQAIGLELAISVGSVNTYWSRIRTKVGKLSRAELVAQIALERAIVDLEALRSENAQLLQVLDQLQTSERRIQRSLERTNALIKALPDAVIVVDAVGTIVLANAAADLLFEYEPGALVGQPVGVLVPARFHGRHAERRKAYLESPTSRPMGSGGLSTGMTRTGKEIAVEVTLNICDTREGRLVTCVMRTVDPMLQPSVLAADRLVSE